LYVGDYFDGTRTRDIILRGQEWTTPEQLAAMPLRTPNAGIVPLGELVSFERTAGPNEIRRVDRQRTITLEVTPPDDVTIQESIELLRTEIEPVMYQQLPPEAQISYVGSADNLSIALRSMGGSFVLAIIILYLLMSALFRSFRDSLLVVLALPLATVGGVVLLRITDLFVNQPMDLMTMIGFITLLGLVVNNAILLVHQARSAERLGTDRRTAVEEAVRIRMRPILMSTMTSLFGMLPLLLIPGPGTELYRGLAAVIVGGMSVSMIFTLILLPALLRIGENAGHNNKIRFA
ncbi:MAG: efflux RND transporter permease subunit, partial [Gammaproteobacteria bacterium]|nr:efflux RND transporter permease subunit [Gammaproteobacteria bacterium]